MPANLENSAMATGLEKISFHSNPKEGQYQRIFRLKVRGWQKVIHASHEKGQFSFQSQRRAMLKNVQTTAQLYSSHMLAK